jgi:hypothetical protein
MSATPPNAAATSSHTQPTAEPTGVSRSESKVIAKARAAGKAQPKVSTSSGWIISKTVVNFWLDTLLLLFFVVLCWTQVVLQYLFPPAPKTQGWTLWGMTFADIQTLQFTLFSIFALGVVVHVTLHWPWVCGVVVNKLRRKKSGGKHQLSDGVRTLWGVATLVVFCNLIGAALALAYLMIKSP